MVDLREIDQRAKAATPGPWDCGEYGEGSIYAQGDSIAGSSCCGCSNAQFNNGADGLFVASAREDVLALVRELVALRKYRFSLEGIETDEYGTPLQSVKGLN